MPFTSAQFDPAAAGATLDPATQTLAFRAPDGSMHVYDDDTLLAVNVALTINRPLFISGEPGSGKTTLAASVAAVLGARFYHRVVTSRTQARDLAWSFDALRQLGDAQTSHAGANQLKERGHYVEPGVLWWAFDPESAARRGMKEDEIPPAQRAADPGKGGSGEDAVVLLDEIDKADPDVPNDLLEPLDARSFTVEETQAPVCHKKGRVLVMITTNGERELPPAFLRRCVSLELKPPTSAWLTAIAMKRFPGDHGEIHSRIASDVMELRQQAKALGLRQPSTAEYLDAIQVCRDLGIDCASPLWERAARAVLWKHEAEFTLRRP